jgi:imidazolonepropionase-like amidohydrolase
VDIAPDDLIRAIVDRRVVLGATGGMAPTPGIPLPPAMASRLPTIIGNFRRLLQAGASIVLGSDAGIGPLKPPDVARWGVAQLTQIGMSPAAALRTATSRAAAVCGLGHRKGRLAPGFDADILAVDGDPLGDPTALHRIRAVYVRGVAVPA